MATLPNFNHYIELHPGIIPNYLNLFPNLQKMIGQKQLIIKEIGDGNLNNVFRITNDSVSIILKQALPYLKCVGRESFLNFTV